RFRAGELVVRFESVAGTNLCATFHPAPFIEKLSGDKFGIVEIVPGQADQDFILLQRLSV
ncbi:MAG TPA: hypothetical protein VMO00_17475, partial [Methylomirabilota bacterium]|nr:hypothetical protein [Methylomirabilota bacterium]HTN72876.1 hypothetical protein [Methylomirabilota bacterium]